MTPPSWIVLLTLCAILTKIDLTSGFALRKPYGECPPAPKPDVRCFSDAGQKCDSSNECQWNEMCCFNGCKDVCMRVSIDRPFRITVPPFLQLFRTPAKPHIPFLYNPFNKYPPPDPIPDYRPDLPPVWFPPMDPLNYVPDEDHLPVFPGGGFDNFP